MKHTFSIFALSLLLAACSSESILENPDILPDTPAQDDDSNRREVLLTLKNSLNLKARGAARADAPIATEEENYIQSLDVYVFGSKEEAGPYTFQELHYFRDDASEVTLPGVNSYSFNLTNASENTTTGLLKLNKGLYVKLYCIANRTHLYQTDAAGAITEFTGFKSLAQTAPGQEANDVTAGVPEEEAFKKFHTPLIDPKATDMTENDILTCPLPMTGAYTTPLDLTDFSSSARTQISFKLSRMVARFDIVNDASDSKFTIEKISMGNGQGGAQYFPIRTLTTDPAKLISYPERTVSAATQVTPNGDTGATSTTKGAFYTWPSPKEDGGYLMLKGKYAVNKTETKEVSYQIPFQQMVNGVGTYIEVSYNHRYTIAITKADDYHLDFTLKVADWDDGESVDEYEPENSFDRNAPLVLDETAGANAGAYVLDDGQTVELLAATGSKLAFKMGSNTALTEELIFKAGSAEWIKKGLDAQGHQRAVTSMDSTYSYVIDDARISDRTKLMPVIIRLTNPASGVRKEIKVVATPGPEVTKAADYTGFSTFDAATLTATMYNLANQTLKLNVSAASRSDRAPENPVVTTGSSAAVAAAASSWLTLDNASVTDAEGSYTLTLGAAQASGTTATVDFTSVASTEKTQITVKLKDPAMTALKEKDFSLGDNRLGMTDGTGGAPKVVMTGVLNNQFTITVTSPEGVEAEAAGGDSWLAVTSSPGAGLANGQKTTVITVKVKDATGMGITPKTDGKITITNKLDGTETIDVYVETSLPDGPVLTMTEEEGNPSSYDAGTKTATVYNAVGQKITLQADANCTVATTDAWLTVDDTNAASHTITIGTAQGSTATTGTVTFTNAQGGVTTVTVALADPAITALTAADFTSTAGTSNTFEAAAGGNAKVTMADPATENAFTLKVTSPNGISVDATETSTWLTVTRTQEVEVSGGKKQATVTVAIVDGTDLSTAISDGKIVLKNAIAGGGDLTVDVVTTVTPAAPAD